MQRCASLRCASRPANVANAANIPMKRSAPCNIASPRQREEKAQRKRRDFIWGVKLVVPPR